MSSTEPPRRRAEAGGRVGTRRARRARRSVASAEWAARAVTRASGGDGRTWTPSYRPLGCLHARDSNLYGSVSRQQPKSVVRARAVSEQKRLADITDTRQITRRESGDYITLHYIDTRRRRACRVWSAAAGQPQPQERSFIPRTDPQWTVLRRRPESSSIVPIAVLPRPC